jgi:CRISPR-associated protein Cas1
MLKKTIYIGNPSYLRTKEEQLIIIDPNSKTTKGRIAIEDMALLLLDNNQITISNQLLIKLQGNNVAIITCDAHHLPFGLMLPMYGHTTYSERIKQQIAVSEPLKKQLWKQTVVQKIKNQEALLKLYNKPAATMQEYWQDVKSGDSTNCEGKAAVHYWKYLFKNFSRVRDGKSPNNLLNFGYAILRSIVARALVSSGLNPIFGIFHKNKYNPYCLADDIMEPYRPFVDKLVVNFVIKHPNENELTKMVKAHLLTIATQDVLIAGKIRPLMVAVTATTASLYKCYIGEIRQIKYPILD